MKALLLIAHGSRRKQSNEEVVAIAGTLKQKCSDYFPVIQAAFLELAEPTIPDGIRQCVDQGATSIIVLPYFLNSGQHVAVDIPEIVTGCKSSYPGVDIIIAPHLGNSDTMTDLLIEIAIAASSDTPA